ncbi:MAG: hypothetical protein C4583_03035 [Anaerolineaceae bacterium]|nr:MAG: hypothetical protein C4583_03035 [Anaerolineaceae bacterium]
MPTYNRKPLYTLSKRNVARERTWYAQPFDFPNTLALILRSRFPDGEQIGWSIPPAPKQAPVGFVQTSDFGLLLEAAPFAQHDWPLPQSAPRSMGFSGA